jgi:hypothetical protein
VSATSAAMKDALAGLRLRGGKRLPVILQTEAAECGLACLAMVASYYGYEIDLPGLRRQASMSLKGATLKRVMEIAGQLKLDTRPLRLEVEELRELKTPCILIRVNLRTGNLGASALGFALGGLRYPGAIRSCSLPRVMSGR